MNWNAISATAELVGATTVVVSLLYVAMQIRHGVKAARYQMTQDLVMARSESHFMVAMNKDFAEFMDKGCYDRESLSDSEKLRFNSYFFAYYNQLDYAYQQHLAGELDPKLWEKLEYETPIYLSLPGVASWWSQDKSRFTSEFVSYLDERVSNIDPSSVVPTMPR